MSIRLLFGALVALLVCVPALPAAEHLQLRGTFAQVKEAEGEDSQKNFSLDLIVAGDRVDWMLTESGRGAWPWTERFGTAAERPSLLYQRTEGVSAVPLFALKVERPEPLAAGASWREEGLTYRVLDEDDPSRDVWRIVASNDYGPRRTFSVAKDSGLVVRLDERVFIGQGVECRLSWEVAERKTLDEAEYEAFTKAFAGLVSLREKLGGERPAREIRWDDEQRELLRKELPAVAQGLKTVPLQTIVAAAQKDTQTQDLRDDALAALKQKALGKEFDKLDLEGIGGDRLTAAGLKGKVTVLHFWDYRDAPLEEPYGQVGYLDFLARQRKEAGVQVYGVVVDERLAERGTRSQAIAGARRVKAFMNLSYPVVLDESGALKHLGDPRPVGAKLPLFVVLGKDGKVAHYHVGFYEVRRDEGLSALDAAVREALAR